MSTSESQQPQMRKKSPVSKRLAGDQREESNQPTGTANLTEQRDRGQPGGGQGRVDITGKVPDDVRVDPNVTEGHPGYDESGSSEIHPLKTGKDK